jgi:HK97 family phage portal protein
MPQTFAPLVNERTSMAVSAVYRCVAIVAGLVAELPLKIYKRGPDGREEQPNHRLAPFLQLTPFPGRPLSAWNWRELWMVNEQLWGNHYSVIRRDGAGREIGFEPAMPWNVQVLKNGYRNVYRCVLWGNAAGFVENMQPGHVEYVDQDDMIHIPGLGFDGIAGMSRIRFFARDSVSLAKMLEEQTGYAHQNGAKIAGMMTAGEAKLSPDGWETWKAKVNAVYAGHQNAGKVFFADKGATFTSMQMSPEDLNTIAARRYQIADISRFFGVPLPLLNETDRSTSWGSGLAEQNLAFLIYTINGVLGRIEAELNMKLLSGTDFYVEFDRHAMMAMDPVKAAEVAAHEIASATLLPNERRRQLNRPPVANGDQPLINAANVPLARIFDASYVPPATPGGVAPASVPEPPAPPDEGGTDAEPTGV